MGSPALHWQSGPGRSLWDWLARLASTFAGFDAAAWEGEAGGGIDAAPRHQVPFGQPSFEIVRAKGEGMQSGCEPGPLR
jgi:hypothetical protein